MKEVLNMTTSFLSKEELTKIGFKKIGKNVFLSRKASIYGPENMEIGNNVRICKW
jgi:acetyltransferase-like isoleucine patch superfamily enzyme